MANLINRNLDGAPTQGRSRECARRKRQNARVLYNRMKPELKARVDAQFERMVQALYDFPPEVIAQMAQLDEAEQGFVEDAINREDTRQEIAAAPEGPTKDVAVALFNLGSEDYARMVLQASKTT